MAKKISYKSIVDNPINEEELKQAKAWWRALSYKQKYSRLRRHLPYAVIIGDVDLIYMYRAGRNNFKN